jgi:hypothetical protein
MPAKKRRLIFELSPEERDKRFKAVLSVAIQKAAALNMPLVYRNELCVKPNMFIHKYPNGRKVLIEQDSHTSIERTVKVLS